MNNVLGFNKFDLEIILSQLKSQNKPLIQEYSATQICTFLYKNREYSDDIISKIADFFDKNINEIAEPLLIKVITNVLKVLQENNISITNFMNKIFPILMHIIYYCNRTIEQYDQVTAVIGSLINKCGTHTSQIIESQVNSIFEKFKKEVSFKYEYTKYAMIVVLKEFLKNSPVISYNKIIESYDSFNDIILNFKDSKEYIRVATHELIKEFLMLLSNRDFVIREDFTKKIYSLCIKEQVKSGTSDPNIIHGVVLVLKACTERREFFNERYKVALDFLNKNKNHKSQIVKIAICDVIPYFSEYLKDVFEDNYYDAFISHFVSLFNSKPTPELKSHLLICFGKLSKIISKRKFLPHLQIISKSIKQDIEKNGQNFQISILNCLADFMKYYSSETLQILPFDFIIEKMFNCGFYESHIIYLNSLLSIYEPSTKENIKILLIVLNVISIIISDRKFVLKDTYLKLKNLTDVELSNDSLKLEFNTTNSQIFSSTYNQMTANAGITQPNSQPNAQNDLSIKKINSYVGSNTMGNFLKENKNSLNDCRKSIITYITTMKSSKLNFNNVMQTLIKNALVFLKNISHPYFAKDILVFYQQFCVKLLENSDPSIKEKIVESASACWIPNIYNINDPATECLMLRKQSTSSFNSGKVVVDKEVEFILNVIIDSFLNFVLSETNETLRYQMLANIDDVRYHTLLAENKFFNKLAFVLKFNDNHLREKAIEIIGKIIQYNYTTIILFLKKNLLGIFTTLEISTNVFEKEDVIILLSYFVRHCGCVIVDYIQFVFTTLIKILKNETTIDDDAVSNFKSNTILVISILSIIKELIANKYYKNKNQIEIYYKDIMRTCFEILKENSAALKVEIALQTILSILENSDDDYKIYYNYCDLANLLIQILIRSSDKNCRVYAMKIFGFIGAMDPDKLERVVARHKTADDDMYIAFLEDDEFVEEGSGDKIPKQNFNFNNSSNRRKRFFIDFQKEITENSLDTCTYHAVNSLMKILRYNNNQETSNKVIVALKEILINLNPNDNSVIYLILPTLIDFLNENEGYILNSIFERIYYIVKYFKSYCKPFIRDLFEIIMKFLNNRDYQQIVCKIFLEILKNFIDEMEIFFPKLIPLMLEILNEKERSLPIRKIIFECFCLMSPKISNYLGLVIPEMVNILSLSMNEIKYTIDNGSNSVSKDQSKNNSFFGAFTSYTASSENKNNDKEKMIAVTERNKDDEIFAFIEKVLNLEAFAQQIPRVVKILLKYMEIVPYSRSKIMNIFLGMLSHFKKNFIAFLPVVLRTAKDCDIHILDYFYKFKSVIDRDEILYLTISSSSKKQVEFEINQSGSSTKAKAKSQVINQDTLLNEFNPSNCSIEDDWYEWFKSSSKSLFLQSPSNALFCCQTVSDYYPPLVRELYNYAFISVWKMLSLDQKSLLISYLNTALENSKTPPEILLTILNLAEFIEREENHIEFINFEKLGQVADVCKAYAKALYYVENDFRNNCDYSSLEKLITLYYELELPESAIGILKMAKKNAQFTNEEDWYLKLHQWNESLKLIEKKQKMNSGKFDRDLIQRNFICLVGLSDWEQLLTLGSEIEKSETSTEDNDDLMTKMAPALSKASLNLGEWDKLSYYNTKIKPEKDEEIYEKNFLNAVLAIKSYNYADAQDYIEKARSAIDDKIRTLLSESYQRAYKLLLANENLYDLEEIIKLNTINNGDTKCEEYIKKKAQIKRRWDDRLEITERDIKTYERILSIRGLVFPLDEDYDTHLKLAKICRKEDRFTTCMIVLNRLSKRLCHCDCNVSVNVKLGISKCLNENNDVKDSETAIENMKYIIDNEIEKIDDKLKSKIYCYHAIWNLQKEEKHLTEAKVQSILSDLKLSTKYNSKNYKAWHCYGMINYKFYEIEHSYITYASNAITGFSNSVCIGGKSISKTLQDLLRLIDLWFQSGSTIVIDQLIRKSFDKIAIESWLLVIPQLLARVGVTSETIRNSLVFILRKIGVNHPLSLSYPLIVMHQSKSKIRSKAADLILSEMKKDHSTLLKECELIINELNRCALLLHEQWSEAIEESAKLFYQSKDINGMIKILKEVHEKMDSPPATMNEVHFHQKYRSELYEAKRLLDDYLRSKNEMDIKQAWDIYHPMFKSMNDNFSTLKYLDLENVSPNLFNFKESQICIPGMYKSGYPIVKISSFSKILTVLNSKQHPRKIVIYGSNGKEYMFLLKGHEDLRQDERAMQLFGLVNTLLSNDQDTSDKNLFIKRFPVIPLSHNTGVIGWVPNCDTLHQLIKEYRISNKINNNLELSLMCKYYPKFDSATFMTKLEIFKNALNGTLGLDLYKVLWKKSKNSEAWLDRRTNYSRSLAVMSMVGYILGLGDRHPSNLMLDRNSGKILHIDFGDCFEVAMKRERFPERVPFRLTRMLIKALEVSGIEGTYRITCENVMRVLRSNKDSLIAILTAFVHDPLISFRLLIPLIMKANKRKKILRGYTNEKITSESLRNDKPEELENVRHVSTHKAKDKNMEDITLEKKRMGSAERQLYIEFEEKEEVESDDLNKIAKIVLERIIDKLQGTDFSKTETLNVKAQVEKLIIQATSHENLSQSYFGWCPFW